MQSSELGTHPAPDDSEPANALLAAIVQSSHSAIVATDFAGRVLSWNPGAELLYGHPARSMVGESIDKVIPAERRADEAELRALVRAGGRVETHRTTRLHAGGRELPVSLLVSPLRDSHGVLIGLTTTARDVSERERAEAQIRAVLDAAPDALLGVDEAGDIVLVNAEAERMFGQSRHELTRMSVHRLVPDGLPAVSAVLHTGEDSTPLDTEQLDHPAPAGPTGGKGWATRTARCRDGGELPVDISCSALYTDRGVVVIAVLRDITERLAVQAEQQRLRDETERQKIEVRMQRAQRLESLGQLAGGIAHDFNNLLAVILNYAAFIIEDGAGTPYAQDAEQIARAGRRGSELTHQLLAFARRDVIRPQALDVDTVVTEAVAMLTRSIGEHIALTAVTAGDLPAVMADPGQLEQVIVNLAVNARDAMPGGGHLTIDTGAVLVDSEHAAGRAGLAPGRYVRVRVSDTGSGMPKGVIDKAFDPFFTTKPNGQGTGLGLATVYGIVTQAGGTAQIYSEPGLGTTITILLPVTDATPRGPELPVDTMDLGGHGATLLLVEDEDALREVTHRILDRAGYRVLVAGDGAQALQVLRAHPGRIDVLLTDVIMPGLLGKALADAVRADRPEIAVVFMSGYAPVLAVHGTLPPDVQLVEKPFTAADLLQVLHQQLNRVA
ncbi:PAS domain S-box protein [Micromonosporaceae bacterium Da 78-11]